MSMPAAYAALVHTGFMENFSERNFKKIYTALFTMIKEDLNETGVANVPGFAKFQITTRKYRLPYQTELKESVTVKARINADFRERCQFVLESRNNTPNSKLVTRLNQKLKMDKYVVATGLNLILTGITFKLTDDTLYSSETGFTIIGLGRFYHTKKGGKSCYRFKASKVFKKN